MSLRHIQSLARRLAAAHGERLPAGASEEAIDSFCRAHSMKLPLDLLTWLRFTNGPVIGPGRTFGVGTGAKWGDAALALARHAGWAEAGYFPLANDGCGNYFLVDTHCGCVGLVDPMVDGDAFAWLVGTSTLRFLEGLFAAELEGAVFPPPSRDAMIAHDPSIERFRRLAPMPWDQEA